MNLKTTRQIRRIAVIVLVIILTATTFLPLTVYGKSRQKMCASGGTNPLSTAWTKTEGAPAMLMNTNSKLHHIWDGILHI